MTIIVNTEKAREIAKDKIREWRKDQFTSNDLVLRDSLLESDSKKKKDAIARRDYLRDLPEQCENKTIKELKEILSTLE
jgi:phage-related minor tail protein